MTARSTMYFALCLVAALVVASASASLDQSFATTPVDANLASIELPLFSGIRWISLVLGLAGLGAMYRQVWRSHQTKE
jgi:hypothetical protein